jgi:hypothetical protein
MKVPATIISLLLLQSVQAQSPSKKTMVWNPWVTAEVGAVWASYEPSTDYRLQGGVQRNNWMLGGGLGMDEYRFKSMPLYAQGRYYYGKGKRRPFALASLGYNFSMEPDRTETSWWGIRTINPPTPTVYRYGSGYYGELGLGYAFRAQKKWGYQLSLSYTRKSMSENFNASTWNGNDYIQTESRNLYRMNRLALRMAVRIGH